MVFEGNGDVADGWGRLAGCGIKWRDQQAQEQQQAPTSAAEVSEAAAAAASAAAQELWECQRCAVASTPCKRNGPNGKKTLCNGTTAMGWGKVCGMGAVFLFFLSIGGWVQERNAFSLLLWQPGGGFHGYHSSWHGLRLT